MSFRHFSIALMSVFLISWSAHARSIGFSETGHLLTDAAGIASPETTVHLGENPAALAMNYRAKIQASAATGNNEWNPMGYGGALFLGNGYVGVKGGIETYNSSTYASKLQDFTLLDVGAAAYVPTLNAAFGGLAYHAIKKTGSSAGLGTVDDWNGDAGLIFNPYGQTRLGMTAFGVMHHISTLAAGFAHNLTPYAVFAADAGTNNKLKGLMIKPSLRILIDRMQLMGGYGYQINKDAPQWTTKGFTAGVGFEFGQFFSLSGYYNHLNKYNVAATLRF